MPHIFVLNKNLLKTVNMDSPNCLENLKRELTSLKMSYMSRGKQWS